jgi:putative spermidine/putrescine transport system substrate-binding protein
MMKVGMLWRALALGGAVMGAAPGHAQDSVVIASFGSLWQEVLQDALKPFEADNNVTVRFTAGSSSDNVTRAIAARNNPDVDVVMGEEMTFTQGLNEGIFAPLDPALVPNLANVAPASVMGDRHGVGVIMQSIGLFYHTANFAAAGFGPPTSWMDLVDRKYCNRVGYMHPNISFGYYALMMLGGGAPNDIPAGIERVVDYQDCIETVDPSGAKHVERAQLGDFDLGVLAHQLVISLADRGAPLAFVIPEEGALLQFTTMAVAKDAPNPEMAQKLVNELLSERVQTILVEKFKASPVNTAVPVPADLIAAGAPDPNDLSRFIPIDGAVLLPNRAQWTQDFVRALAQ